MQLKLELSITPLEDLTHSHSNIITCGECYKENECFDYVPISNGKIDCYSLNFMMYICEGCYNGKNINGELDECLSNYRRLKKIKTQQYNFRLEVLKTSFTGKRELLIEKNNVKPSRGKRAC